ncbi:MULTISPECIES: type II secretion system protein [Sporosarcina]|uniref:type II secretion system protein n=1 Tax=Sporosarcina TaxID=1569 RepID=UPI0005910905|nr:MULTISPECIES: prepilin-type N-terminal cleavage/methylation domain-containing protein [Sporosarcina]WJY28172.1 type II secretion system protein [Sporosarcina sp. 0.2-SM1T-5]
MKEFLQKKIKNEKGLTLVELLAVIVILGIIAAIAVPSIGNIIQNSREKAVLADATNAIEAANLFFAEHPDKTTVSLKTASTEGGYKLEPEYLQESSLTSATVNKKDDNSLTITFSGEAGKKTVSATDATKKDLSEKTDVIKIGTTSKPSK